MENNSIIQIDKTVCTGCGLCAEKCPKGCIKMISNEEGFLVPSIDESVCINCGLCLKNCPATSVSDNLFYLDERKYFCANIKDKGTLIKSSSGGMFGVIAQHIINNGGYVCGCVYNENVQAVHILTNKVEDVERMYGSKYVQSTAHECFNEIKDLLNAQKEVLFVGTGALMSPVTSLQGESIPSIAHAVLLTSEGGLV